MNSEKCGTKVMWAGRILTVLVALPFIPSIVGKLSGGPEIAQGMEHLGWQTVPVLGLAIAEIVSLLLYVFRPTSFIGAILLTGYLGGAIAAHVRINEAFAIPAILGVLVWVALGLRDARIRALVPCCGCKGSAKTA